MAVIPEGVRTSSVHADRVLASATGQQVAAIPSLVDNTGGTVEAEVNAVPALAVVPAVLADAAQRAEINATTLPAIRDGLASINAKLDQVLAALRATGGIAT